MSGFEEENPNQKAHEKQDLLARLRASRERYLAVLSGVNEASCRIHPEEGAWSALDCAEHVSGAERGMFQMLMDRKPSNAPPDRQKDLIILRMADDGTEKRQAPERSRPKGRFETLDEARLAFVKGREQTIAWVEQNEEDLRKFVVTHPLGEFDAHQLLLIMAMHAERHARQIERIMNSPACQAALQKAV